MDCNHWIKLDDYSLAIVDIVEDYDNRGFVITRVSVPPTHRGQGWGSMLMERVLDAADRAGVSLILEIVPGGGLSYGQLEAWYRGYGFRPWHGLWRRKPCGN